MSDLSIPQAGVPLTKSNPPQLIAEDWYRQLSALFSQFRTTTRGLEDAEGGLATKAAKAQSDAYHGVILVPQNQTITLVLKLTHGLTITGTTTECASGTCTATFAINGTPLGGTANSVSTSEETQAHVSANVAAAGDSLKVTISANASCLRLSFSIAYTYELA